MSTSQRLQSAISAELARQQRGLDLLEGVASVKIEVYFKPGGPDDVNIFPQTKGRAELERIQVTPIVKA